MSKYLIDKAGIPCHLVYVVLLVLFCLSLVHGMMFVLDLTQQYSTTKI